MLNFSQFKLIARQAGFQKYFKNTSWLFAEKIFRMVVGLGVGVWVARYLGPDQYGLFNYAFSFVAIFASIASLGLDQIVVRELVKSPEKTEVLLGTSFFLKLAGALGSIFLILVTLKLTEDESLTTYLVLIISLSTIFQSFNVIDFYFQSQVISKYLLFSNIISLSLSSLAKVILILSDAPLLAFAGVVVFDSLILALGLAYFFFRVRGRVPLTSWRFDNHIAKLLVKDSWPLIFSGIVLMVQARVDQLMLKEMSTNEQVGHYSVALRLVEVFGFIPMMLQNSLMPSLINCKNTSLRLFKDRLINYYRLNFLAFILVAVPLFLGGSLIVDVLFGAEYAPAGVLLSIMSIRVLFANMGVARGTYFLIENLVKFSLWTLLIGTIVNIGLNYYWIQSYQAEGAVYSTIVSFTVTIFIVDLFHRKARKNIIMMLKAMLTVYKMKLIGVINNLNE